MPHIFDNFSSKFDFLVPCRLGDLIQDIVVHHFELLARARSARLTSAIRRGRRSNSRRGSTYPGGNRSLLRTRREKDAIR